MNKYTVLGIISIIIFGLVLYTLLLPKNQATNEALNVTNNMANKEELVIEDIEIGTGDNVVESGDDIVIHYKGTLADGTVFDSSYDRGEPFQTTIGVGQVIEGWDKGVIGMKAGGKRKLVIPPDMAYGEQGVGSIPPNSTLTFEVELVEILK